MAAGLREAAKTQLAAGEIRTHQYNEIVRVSNDSHSLNRTLDQLEVNENALGAIDWAAIKDWIIENWPTILRIVISIAMLLEPQDEEV